MAGITLNLDGDVSIARVESDEDSLSINLLSFLDGTTEVYSRDWVTFHGSIDDYRHLAEAILAALPPESAIERGRRVLGEPVNA